MGWDRPIPEGCCLTDKIPVRAERVRTEQWPECVTNVTIVKTGIIVIENYINESEYFYIVISN